VPEGSRGADRGARARPGRGGGGGVGPGGARGRGGRRGRGEEGEDGRRSSQLAAEQAEPGRRGGVPASAYRGTACTWCASAAPRAVQSHFRAWKKRKEFLHTRRNVLEIPVRALPLLHLIARYSPRKTENSSRLKRGCPQDPGARLPCTSSHGLYRIEKGCYQSRCKPLPCTQCSPTN